MTILIKLTFESQTPSPTTKEILILLNRASSCFMWSKKPYILRIILKLIPVSLSTLKWEKFYLGMRSNKISKAKGNKTT